MEDRKFTPEEAQKIVEMSLRFQTQWNDNVSLTEIERSALELGVEPRFVQMAIQQMDQPKSTPPTDLPRTRAEKGAQTFIGIYSAGYALATWFFAMHILSIYSHLQFKDLVAFLVMAAIFGLFSRAQKRPWLLVVPLVVTASMTFAAVVFTTITRLDHRSLGQVVEDMFASVMVQAGAMLIGYALASLFEALQGLNRRSMTS